MEHWLTLIVMRSSIKKMKGETSSPPMVPIAEVFWSWIGAFLGIASVSYLHYNMVPQSDMVMVVGSFGASAVLIYGAPSGPLSQPRNLIGGHLVSALVGVACYQLLSEYMWLAASISVATAIGMMHLTKSLHPPGGATALIAVIGSDQVHELGFYYVFIPVMAGAFIMLLIALVVNNIPSSRKYPVFWL
jgi:CBS-domain-containing membrane protein